jgi:hypothetical protein
VVGGALAIDTMPLTTLDVFREHGVVAPTLEKDADEALGTIRRIEKTLVIVREHLAATAGLVSVGIVGVALAAPL